MKEERLIDEVLIEKATIEIDKMKDYEYDSMVDLYISGFSSGREFATRVYAPEEEISLTKQAVINKLADMNTEQIDLLADFMECRLMQRLGDAQND